VETVLQVNLETLLINSVKIVQPIVSLVKPPPQPVLPVFQPDSSNQEFVKTHVTPDSILAQTKFVFLVTLNVQLAPVNSIAKPVLLTTICTSLLVVELVLMDTMEITQIIHAKLVELNAQPVIQLLCAKLVTVVTNYTPLMLTLNIVFVNPINFKIII
jgi:hypothetical protein